MRDEQTPYEAPSIEEIDTDGAPISTAAGNQTQPPMTG
jgi:hypothetical protein